MISRFSNLKFALNTFQNNLSRIAMSTDTKEHHFETHSNIVWVDCEMTGLNPQTDKLLEIAVVLTDSSLEILSSIGPFVIKTPPEILNNMNDWCKKNHKKSGLIDACLVSQLTVDDVDKQIFNFLNSQSIKLAPLAGNSVSYDRQFLEKYCPKFSSCLHYRTIDVSSFKEMIR